MMTETEATGKWCPHSRSEAHGGANRLSGGDGGIGCCIGSACMAWRWVPNRGFVQESDPKHPFASVPVQPELPPVKGYCGLAGKP